MARLESQSKLGYYPTPERTLGFILSWLSAPGEGLLRRYLDPCCGKGEALAAIANGHAESFGIELSDVRASAAEDQLAHVINTGYEYAVLTPETFSLAILNPPYDGEETTGGGKRLEEVFLCDMPTTDVLIPGGVLIFIIPHKRINERIARHLAGWYRDLRCFRLPAGEYEMFHQIVVFAVRRPTYEIPDGETLKGVLEWRNGSRIARYDDVDEKALLPRFLEQLEAVLGPRPSSVNLKDGQPIATRAADDAARAWMAKAQQLIAEAETAQTLRYTTRKTRVPMIEQLPELMAGGGEYVVPETPLKGKGGRPFRFQYQAVSDEDYLREAEEAARRLDATRDWSDLIPALAPPRIEPAMTPKRGHIAMQVSGGLLGTNLVRDLTGRTLLLKGSVDKVQVTKPTADLDAEAAFEEDEDDKKKKLRKVEIDEQFRTLLSTLTEDGELSTLADPALIAPLLEQYVGQLAEVVQARNVPQYDMKPESWEWAVFDHLSRGRQLPGRKETGLTDFQKHLAIALGRLCLKHGAGFCNAEMGSGKAQPLRAKLLTPEGWRTMGDIQVGDLVIGANGKATRVLSVFPQGRKKIYRVTFTDGSTAECCQDHLWTVNTPLNKWKGKPAKTMSLRDIRSRGLAHANGNLQHFIPLVEPIRFSAKALPLDPYLLGVLLGDGCLRIDGVSLVSADEDILTFVRSVLPAGVGIHPQHMTGYDYRITTGSRGGDAATRPGNGVLQAIRLLGLSGCKSGDKFIPTEYLLGSVDQRVALLQGLLDTDAYVTPNSCTVEYVTVSPRLADDVTFLVQSLGGTVTRRKKDTHYLYNGEKRTGQLAHRLFIAIPNEIQAFRLPRKLAAYQPRSKYQPSRAIKTVEFVGRMEAWCIKVDAEDGLYLTDNCVVTHNTSVGIAVAEYIRTAHQRQGRDETAYPALVVGPGIVTGAENWPKEIVEVTPGAAARVVVVGAKPLPKPGKIGRYLADLGLELKEDRFEGKSAAWVMNAIHETATKQAQAVSDELLAALAESLCRAEKHPPVRRKGAKAPNLLDGRVGGFRWLELDVPRDPNSEDDLKGKYSLAQFIAEYQAGALPEKSFAIVSYETAKLGSGRVPAMTSRHIRVRWRDENGKRHSEIQTVYACPKCGAIVAEDYDEETGAPEGPVTPAYAEQYVALKRRFCKAPAPKRLWDADKVKHVIVIHDEDGNRYVCGSPLFENSGLRRIAAADYARKKAKGIFGLCLVDEIHKAKSKGSGVGFALTALTATARYTIGLTGTLFGGYSTSIFWLMYRLCPEVRHAFAFNDERRWTERYGLLKRTFYTDKDAGAVDEDGAFTGTKFFETVSERPGISPAIAGVGLKYCTFSSLKDVGLPLPQYGEEIVRLDLTPAMKEQYARADGSAEKKGLFEWALRRMEDDDGKGAISVWLNSALNRPDAMFRGEHVVFRPRVSGRGRFAIRRTESVATFEPAVAAGEWLPKEEWTAKTCLAELQLGRKTLVYVRQTGDRDIQERLAECLKARGLRVGILRPSLAPEKRAGWIKKHVGEMDVLLTNARLVEVGLNLTMFSTAIFAEMEWSLYTVWQSMRRLYRPGAPKPVKLFFPVYRGTLEELALDLIGAKMLAAMCFYGDEAGGALVDENDQGNLINDIVRKAMGELQVGRAEGIFSLGNDLLVTELPLGSPTAVSPRVITLAELALRRRELVQSARRVKRLPAPGNDHTQPTLF